MEPGGSSPLSKLEPRFTFSTYIIYLKDLFLILSFIYIFASQVVSFALDIRTENVGVSFLAPDCYISLPSPSSVVARPNFIC